MTVADFLKAALKWLPDLLAMPTRIRELATEKQAESDPRPTCRSCGKARIGAERIDPTPQRHTTAYLGDCLVCGARWRVYVNTNPMELGQMVGVPQRAPPSA